LDANEISGKPGLNLQGAKPRKSRRRAWEINLKGDGQTWERVTTPPPAGRQVFRFKDQPSDEQMELIRHYGFTWDDEHREAHRPDDVAGRTAADGLAWYLKAIELRPEAAKSI
jgi:hypothetical protein